MMVMTSSANTFLRRWLRPLKRDRHVTAVAAFLLGGASLSLFPYLASFVGIAVLVVLVVRRVLSTRRAPEFSDFDLALFQPDGPAFTRALQANLDALVVGSVIEIKPHSTLTSRMGLRHVGWDPSQITVDFTGNSFDSTRAVSVFGPLEEFDPPNGMKFSVVSASIAGTDDELRLGLEATDYFTLQSIKKQLQCSPEQRALLGSLDPRQNRVPNSLCLHMIVRFSDGNVLALKNDQSKTWEPGAWAITAEEQIKDLDIQSGKPIENHFRRALCEEIFGLTSQSETLESRWERVSGRVRDMRIASLFVEETINNFSLLGLCQLEETHQEFVASSRRLLAEGDYSRDKEGAMYWFAETELRRLLVRGSGEAVPLFGGSCYRVVATGLHSTSRYRSYRLLRVLRGSGLEPLDT